MPIQVPIVGSIGVVGGSFGFDKLIDKIGVERRLYTSGEHKAMLDPFLPEKPDDVERLKRLAARNSRRFHRAGEVAPRAASSTAPKKASFSGEYWTGRHALSLGLVDAIGDLRARAAANASATRSIRR